MQRHEKPWSAYPRAVVDSHGIPEGADVPIRRERKTRAIEGTVSLGMYWGKQSGTCEYLIPALGRIEAMRSLVGVVDPSPKIIPQAPVSVVRKAPVKPVVVPHKAFVHWWEKAKVDRKDQMRQPIQRSYVASKHTPEENARHFYQMRKSGLVRPKAVRLIEQGRVYGPGEAERHAVIVTGKRKFGPDPRSKTFKRTSCPFAGTATVGTQTNRPGTRTAATQLLGGSHWGGKTGKWQGIVRSVNTQVDTQELESGELRSRTRSRSRGRSRSRSRGELKPSNSSIAVQTVVEVVEEGVQTLKPVLVDSPTQTITRVGVSSSTQTIADLIPRESVRKALQNADNNLKYVFGAAEDTIKHVKGGPRMTECFKRLLQARTVAKNVNLEGSWFA